MLKTIYQVIKQKVKKYIKKSQESDARIEYIRHYDSLTELPNRKILIETFNRELALSKVTERAIIVLNIDRLHSINELYGRDIGDAVILKLTQRLKDRYKEKAIIFREDHFYLYMEDISVNELDQIGQIMLKLIGMPMKVDERTFHITGSIGISHYPSTGESISILLQQAEIAMAKVKQEGKNNYTVITAADISEIERKRKLEFDLKDILSREELYLAYQPEVCLQTGEIKAVEALLRWEHPELGNISPVEFIPIAEETGAIHEIGKWVIREATSQGREWHDQGLKISLAVNISYVQFKNQHLVEDIMDILEQTHFNANYFIIEITESLMKDLDYVELVTKDLNKQKIRIAIDDFGTGYSSLSVLGNMYIDMIKIDRTFIKNLPADEKSMQIVNTMIQIGKNLETIVVAEGVETVGQLDYLLDNGCKYAQGYYFSKPISGAEILIYGKKKT